MKLYKRKNKKGFTLVEILTVLVIMSLLIVVAVPASQGISRRISKRTYDTKIELASQGAQLWAENNESCFTCSGSGCSTKCLNAVCQVDDDESDEKVCEIKLGFLASEDYFNYDDVNNKLIVNPINNELINDETVTVIFNKKDGSFTTDIDKNEFVTLYFNGNGATSGYQSSITCKKDLDCVLPNNLFEKTKFEYAGWSLQAIGGVLYQPNEAIKINKDTTLYAVWNAAKYELAFNPNTGLGHMNSEVCDHGEPCLIPSNLFTKEFHDFNGWSLDKDASPSYVSGGNIILEKNTTLFASWVLKKYNLNFNGNTATSGTMSPVKCEHDLACTIPDNAFLKTGHSFEGWSTTTGGAVSYANKGSIKITSDITLYAKWTPNTYAVSYNANGGSGAPANQTKTYGINLTLTGSLPTREGHQFAGWNTNSSGTGTAYTPGANYTGNAALTLYAKWTPNTYAVSYNANGGSGAPANQTKTYGVNLALSSAKPTRTGHTFASWNTNSSGTGTTYTPGATYTGNAALALYAKWTPNTYAVSYNANGGSGAPANQTKTYGVNLALSTTKPTRTGYTFASWNTNSSGTGTTYTPGATYTGNSALALYAKWTPNKYTISFNANGGSGAPGAQTKTYGVNLSLSTTKPTRTGYVFDGWNTNSAGTGTNYASGASYTGNATATLYAKWKDTTPPTCRTQSPAVSANDSSWTNANRTISVGCSDTGSGCSASTFSKTYSSGTHKSRTITISDKAGNKRECPVNVYVDKQKLYTPNFPKDAVKCPYRGALTVGEDPVSLSCTTTSFQSLSDITCTVKCYVYPDVAFGGTRYRLGAQSWEQLDPGDNATYSGFGGTTDWIDTKTGKYPTKVKAGSKLYLQHKDKAGNWSSKLFVVYK